MTDKLYNKKIIFAPWAAHNKKYASYQSWYKPIKEIFRNFVSFDPQDEMNKIGKEAMNKKFLNLVDKEKPDYIFLWLIYDEISLETLSKIREISPKTKIVNFFGDDDILYDNFSRYYSHFIDYGLLFQVKYLDDYKKDKLIKAFPSSGATISVFMPQKLEKKYDVTFIGTPKQDRYEVMKYLHKNGFNVRIFGDGWKSYPDIKEICGGPLSQDEMIKKINESKINLSFNKNYLGGSHIKGRIFEIISCKSFLLSEYFEDHLKFFKSNEIAMYTDKEDLIKKVRYYLKNEKEREAIAERAYNRMIKQYDLKKQVQNAFKSIINDKNRTKKIDLENKPSNVFYMDLKTINFHKEKIKEITKKYEYICFNKDSVPLKFRDIIQIKSLENTEKQVSCCDYYFSSKKLGNYLAMYSKFSYYHLGKENFNLIISPAQLMVKKEYFMENISMFRKMMAGENVNILTDQNTTFVTIPLVKIRNLRNISKVTNSKVFIFSFESQINKLISEGRILIDPYIYKLFINSFLRKDFIWKHLLVKLFERFNFRRLVGGNV